LRRDVLLLSLAAFASAGSLRASDPLLPLIAADYGTTTGAASGAITGFLLSYGLLQVLYGPLGDRFGRYRTIAFACLVSALGSAACAAAPSLQALVVARFAAGATIGALIPLSMAWIGDSFPYERRQTVLARFLVGQMLGSAFGSALAGWLGEVLSWRAIFAVLAALFVLVAAALALELKRNPLAAGSAPTRSLAQSVARLPRVLVHAAVRSLLAAVFIEGLLLSGAFAFVALSFQERHAIGPGLAGTLLSAWAIAGLAYATLARRAVARLGEKGLVTAGGAALALGYAGLAFSPALWFSTACVGAAGAGYYMMHTTLQARITEAAPEDRGSAVSLFAASLFIGGAFGVWLGSLLVEAAGFAALFAAGAVGLAALSAVVRSRLLARAPQ
jgi:predicted MFS family arabinose efflux permease